MRQVMVVAYHCHRGKEYLISFNLTLNFNEILLKSFKTNYQYLTTMYCKALYELFKKYISMDKTQRLIETNIIIIIMIKNWGACPPQNI